MGARRATRTPPSTVAAVSPLSTTHCPGAPTRPRSGRIVAHPASATTLATAKACRTSLELSMARSNPPLSPTPRLAEGLPAGTSAVPTDCHLPTPNKRLAPVDADPGTGRTGGWRTRCIVRTNSREPSLALHGALRAGARRAGFSRPAADEGGRRRAGLGRGAVCGRGEADLRRGGGGAVAAAGVHPRREPVAGRRNAASGQRGRDRSRVL